MDPKTELVVFKKKEVFILIVLLGLVALFSFTLGLRLGKNLATVSKPTHIEQPPLTETETATSAEHPQTHQETHPQLQKPDVSSTPHESSAEDVADAELEKEAEETKIGTSKIVPLDLPKQKTAIRPTDARFTLQVGSHKTVAEASEQVSQLKRHDLDAFYLEANVPGRGTWYRVGIGLYSTKEAAEQAATKLKGAKDLPPYIVQKVSE